MADQHDDKKRGCGCCNEKKEHKECKDNCAADECEVAQEKMVLYNYIQAVENDLIPGTEVALGGLFLAPFPGGATGALTTTLASGADIGVNTGIFTPTLTGTYSATVLPSLPTPVATNVADNLVVSFALATGTGAVAPIIAGVTVINGTPAISASTDPFSTATYTLSPVTLTVTGTSPAQVVSGTATLTVSYAGTLPAGLVFDGSVQLNGVPALAFTLDPSAVCCWSTVRAYITAHGLVALLPEAPHVDPIRPLTICDGLAITEYVISRINELCLPEFVKVSIVDKIVSAFQQAQEANADLIANTCPVSRGFENGYSLCKSNDIPECGPIYIANQPALLQGLLYSKFLLRAYFVNSCDCDLTFEHACKFVFGRFCVIDVATRTNLQ